MRQVSIFTLFYKSLYNPKEIAKFRFLGIGKTILYVFSLILLSSLPGIYEALAVKQIGSNGMSGIGADTGTKLILIPILALAAYLINAGTIILKISVLAGVGVIIAKLLDRKLPYRLSWRLTAFCITFPTSFFAFIFLLGIDIPGDSIIDFTIILLFQFLSIKAIPKPRRR